MEKMYVRFKTEEKKRIDETIATQKKWISSVIEQQQYQCDTSTISPIWAELYQFVWYFCLIDLHLHLVDSFEWRVFSTKNFTCYDFNQPNIIFDA